jgi:hypothetical protein
MPEPFVLGLTIADLLSNAHFFFGKVKGATEQIESIAHELEICFGLLDSLKKRLEAREDTEESDVDLTLMRNVEEKLLKKLNRLLAPYRNTSGTTRRGWTVKLRWKLKKRRLKALEKELERWELNLKAALYTAQWYVHQLEHSI